MFLWKECIHHDKRKAFVSWTHHCIPSACRMPEVGRCSVKCYGKDLINEWTKSYWSQLSTIYRMSWKANAFSPTNNIKNQKACRVWISFSLTFINLYPLYLSSHLNFLLPISLGKNIKGSLLSQKSFTQPQAAGHAKEFWGNSPQIDFFF